MSENAGIIKRGPPLSLFCFRVLPLLLSGIVFLPNESIAHSAAAKNSYGDLYHLCLLFSIGTVAIICLSWLWFLNLRRIVRKRTREIRAGEANLRVTLNAIGEGVIATDADGRIVRFNPEAERITGYRPETALNRPVKEILIISEPNAAESRFDPFDYISQNGSYTSPPDGRKLTIKNGKICRISDTGAPIKDDDGKMIGVVIIFRDISEEYRIRERLQKSEADLVAAQYLSGTGGFTLDVATGDTIWTKGMYRLLKYEEGEPIDYETISKKLHHPDDYKRATTWLEECFQSGEKELPPIESRLVCKDGEIIYVLLKGRIEYEGSRAKTLFGILQDITPLKKAEVALSKSEKRFRTIMEQSPIAMQIYDRNGTLLNANSAWFTLWGITEKEKTIGLYNIFLDSQLAKKNLLPLFEKAFSGELKEFPDIEYTADFDGIAPRRRIVRSKIYPLKHPDGYFDNIVIFNEDITDQKRIEEDLHKAEKLKSLGTLAGGIAHDFNNILTGISGNVSLARESISDNKPASLFLDEAEKSIERAIQLASQLLTFAEGGAPVATVMDLFTLAESSARFDLSGSNVRPILSSDGRPTNAKADRSQIRHVFSCLIRNADQAMPDGGCLYIRFSTQFLKQNEISHLPEGEYIRIDFQDEGPGISPDRIDRIFDPFFSTKPGGTGMGLSAAYSIISRHKGAITVSTSKPHGAIFSLYIPAAEVQTEPLDQADATPESVAAVEKGKILIMDDEPIIRKLASEMLKRSGYTPVSVKDGQEAVDLFKAAFEDANPFQATIMDLTIPGGMGGKDAVKRILEIDPNAICIVSSGYAADPVMADHSRYGFKGAVAKPYTAEELRKTLRVALQ